MTKEIFAISAFTVPCEGVSSSNNIAPLADKPANPTITVYSNGTRDVGCPYLDKVKGKCLAGFSVSSENVPCIQLFPKNSDSKIVLHGYSTDKTPRITLNGLEIRKRRMDIDLSPTKLGKSIGVSRGSMENIERGKTVGSRLASFAAVRLAEFFQIPVEELLANPEDAQRVIDQYEKMKERQARISTAAS